MSSSQVNQQIEIAKAIELLKNGDVVGMPTETVYGLAARFDDSKAVEKIFSTKARPFFDPLILHVADIAQAKSLFRDWTKILQILAAQFWPGPLTVVAEKKDSVSDLITSGLTSVAVRCPNHPVALQMIGDLGLPVAAPSANRFGRTSPTTAAHVRSEFSDKVFVVDGGPCFVGIESTILKVTEDPSKGVQLEIFRKGQISEIKISEVLKQNQINFTWAKADQTKTSAPGMMKHHYMPDTPIVVLPKTVISSLASVDEKVRQLILEKLKLLPAEWEGVRLSRPNEIKILSEFDLGKDPVLSARLLYSQLRELSKSKSDVIIWLKEDHYDSNFEAVLERLQKAVSVVISEKELKKD